MNLREVFFKSEPNLPFPRCQHRSPAGRQCSQPICSASPDFCFTHKPKPEDLLIAELTAAAGTLSTPAEIHNFLTRVTLLRVQGRITPKEASSYAYLCLILQRGQREIAYHEKLRQERAEREAGQASYSKSLSTLWKIPRPDRSDLSDPPNNIAPGTTAQTPPAGDELARPSSPIAPTPPSLAEATSPPISPASSTSSSAPAEGPSSLCHPDRRSASSADRSGGTAATNPAPPHADGTNTPSTENSAIRKSDSAKKSPAVATPPAPKPLPPDFYNHFFPIDFTLPPGLQDHSKNIPHPDAAECARRNARRGLNFNRRSSLSRFWR